MAQHPPSTVVVDYECLQKLCETIGKLKWQYVPETERRTDLGDRLIITRVYEATVKTKGKPNIVHTYLVILIYKNTVPAYKSSLIKLKEVQK
jgi:hypothetical protein